MGKLINLNFLKEWRNLNFKPLLLFHQAGKCKKFTVQKNVIHCVLWLWRWMREGSTCIMSPILILPHCFVVYCHAECSLSLARYDIQMWPSGSRNLHTHNISSLFWHIITQYIHKVCRREKDSWPVLAVPHILFFLPFEIESNIQHTQQLH